MTLMMHARIHHSNACSMRTIVVVLVRLQAILKKKGKVEMAKKKATKKKGTKKKTKKRKKR